MCYVVQKKKQCTVSTLCLCLHTKAETIINNSVVGKYFKTTFCGVRCFKKLMDNVDKNKY